MRSRSAAALLLFFSFLVFEPVRAAAPPAKIIITSGSFSERETVIYVAQDQGLFRKYGLDLSFVQVRNGPVGMSALSSGETQFHWGSVSAANLGAIAEGADLVFVARFINKLTGNFTIRKGILFPLLIYLMAPIKIQNSSTLVDCPMKFITLF